MDAKDRAKLYAEFLETAAKEYRCAITDMPAKMAASRRLSFEVYTAQLIEGRNPDPATTLIPGVGTSALGHKQTSALCR